MKFLVSSLLIPTVVTKAQDIRHRGNVESGGKPNIDYIRDLQSDELVDLSLSLPAVAGIEGQVEVAVVSKAGKAEHQSCVFDSQSDLCCNLRFLYEDIYQCPYEQDQTTPEICFATMFMAGGQERCAWAMDIFDLNGGEEQAVQVAVSTMVCLKFGDYVCEIIYGLIDTYSAVMDSAHRSMEYLSNAQDRHEGEVKPFKSRVLPETVEVADVSVQHESKSGKTTAPTVSLAPSNSPAPSSTCVYQSPSELCCSLQTMYEKKYKCGNKLDDETGEICFASIFMAYIGNGQEQCPWTKAVLDANGGEAQATEDIIRILACHQFGPFVCDAIKSAIVTASAVIDFEHRAMEYLTNPLN